MVREAAGLRHPVRLFERDGRTYYGSTIQSAKNTETVDR